MSFECLPTHPLAHRTHLHTHPPTHAHTVPTRTLYPRPGIHPHSRFCIHPHSRLRHVRTSRFLRIHHDSYNPYIAALGNASSVATLLTKRRAAADDEAVVFLVERADAIFFAGGDQHTYVNMSCMAHLMR
jgi:cyanophycinase-like exopeptidase